MESRVQDRTSASARSANTSPDATPFFGPISGLVHPQLSVYCDGESFTRHGGLIPRQPSCHHEECQKSYRTLLKMAHRATSQAATSAESNNIPSGHLTSHAGNGHARTAYRHHPYDVPHSAGRRMSPVDTTPSPISTDGSSELPPHHASHPSDNYDHYYTPSTSPFLHAVRSMNVGRSRTSSRVPSRAPSPVPLHLPPAVTALDTIRSSSSNVSIGRTDRYHRSHRSHPILHSPKEGGGYPTENQAHFYPHSHGGTPPGTPAPLSSMMMMSRQKRTNSGGAAASGPSHSQSQSKHSIGALLSDPIPHSTGALSSHFAIDGPTAAPTPSLSSSASNSSTASGQYRNRKMASPSDTTVTEATMLPPLNFPPPPSRSRPSSEYAASPVSRSLANSPEMPSTLHSTFNKHPPLPPLIPGLPASPLVNTTSGGGGSGALGGGRASVSYPSSPASASSSTTPSSATSHSHLAHSVRIAFGMTPIHPPSFPSSRGRSTIGGNSNGGGIARSNGVRTRSSSPPIILAPLKYVGTKDEDEEDVKLPHLEALTGRLEMLSRRERSADEMDIDDLH